MPGTAAQALKMTCSQEFIHHEVPMGALMALFEYSKTVRLKGMKVGSARQTSKHMQQHMEKQMSLTIVLYIYIIN